MEKNNSMVGPKAYIHTDRLVNNYKVISQHIGGVPVMAIVKANGYGHGAVGVSKVLESAGVNFFGVFSFNEALELRANGIRSDVFLLCRLQSEFLSEAIKYNITLNLSWPDDLDLLIDYHKSNGNIPKVHIKIDTGMTRLGIPYDRISEVFKKLAAAPQINCEGIYSHFATADEGDPSYARYQLNLFNKALKVAKQNNLKFKYTHLTNSGAILNLPEAHFNLVRVGMLLYGAFPSSEVPRELPIEPVMEFRAPLVMIRKVKAGTYVSYGGKYKTTNDTNIGVIQVGFADGFPRPWYENGYVVYGGKQYRIAGRVCMDQLIVDFGEDEPQVGSEVLLFGKNGQDKLQAEQIAEEIDSTVYILLSAVGGRTERIFLRSEHNPT
ncbi:alanine racemase [Candidatus Neomarinimicrobiota bacterium]